MNTGGIALGADGTVYAGAWNYSFSAYAPDGKVKWHRACQEEMTGGVAIAPDGTILVAGRGDGPDWSSALYSCRPWARLNRDFTL
jgi:outer membrane protein assembly factor BamB